MKVRRVPIFAMLLALPMGCGSTLTAHAIIGRGAPAHTRPVEIFLVGQRTPRNYEEVAVVQAIARGDHGDAAHALDGLRREAAALGCDAVLAVRVDVGTRQVAAVGVAVRWLSGAPPPSTSLPAPWDPPASSPAAPSAPRAPWSVPPD
jgi:hypothetical protein